MEKQKTEEQKTEEQPKTTILSTDTGEFDLTNILALAFGRGTTD